MLACDRGRGKRGVLTRLDGAGSLISSTGDALADLGGGGLLGVGGDCGMCQCYAVVDGWAAGAHASQTLARRDPCGGCQTC